MRQTITKGVASIYTDVPTLRPGTGNVVSARKIRVEGDLQGRSG
jgi:hypothetical protein